MSSWFCPRRRTKCVRESPLPRHFRSPLAGGESGGRCALHTPFPAAVRCACARVLRRARGARVHACRRRPGRWWGGWGSSFSSQPSHLAAPRACLSHRRPRLSCAPCAPAGFAAVLFAAVHPAAAQAHKVGGGVAVPCASGVPSRREKGARSPTRGAHARRAPRRWLHVCTPCAARRVCARAALPPATPPLLCSPHCPPVGARARAAIHHTRPSTMSGSKLAPAKSQDGVLQANQPSSFKCFSPSRLSFLASSAAGACLRFAPSGTLPPLGVLRLQLHGLPQSEGVREYRTHTQTHARPAHCTRPADGRFHACANGHRPSQVCLS